MINIRRARLTTDPGAQQTARVTARVGQVEAKSMEYVNAAKILPPRLLEDIRRYFPGGLLWVPKAGGSNLERDELVIKLLENKVAVKEVAALAQISSRQVYRIIKKHRSENGGDMN